MTDTNISREAKLQSAIMTQPDTSFCSEALALSHMDRIAWRKVGSIHGWEPYSWEAVDHETDHETASTDVIIQGCIPRLLKSGKNKGKKTWRDNDQHRKVVVTGEEILAEQTAYSIATANCANCLGEGQTVYSWSSTEGIKKRECYKCKGTGKHHD